MTVNHGVRGSSPWRGAIFLVMVRWRSGLTHMPFTHAFTGSNPVRITIKVNRLVFCKRLIFFDFTGDFSQFRLEYPLFLYIYETFRFKHLGRLTTDSNLLSWRLEPLVLMGLEPIRDNGGNKLRFDV